MKVLQLISSGGYYGAENMLLNLCASQETAGCQNSLLLFYNVHAPNVEFYERARREGWATYEIESSHNPHITNPAALLAILNEIATA